MADVLFEVRGVAGLITLNRPQALNALNRSTCLAIDAQLDAWATDDAVRLVIIAGAGDRAFCAGGDVVAVAKAGQAGSDEWEGFFADEYRMNHAIATYPKPYVALIGGIVMGGGVGLSIHAPYRVANEKTLFAMPETGIGLLPDVGGSHALPRLPGEIGIFAGLTGARFAPADCMWAGIATHFVKSDQTDALVAALTGGEDIEAALDRVSADAGESPHSRYRDAIDFHFAHDEVSEIMASLAAGDEWAQAQHAVMARMSPTSCKLTLRALREGAFLNIAGALANEYRVVCGIKHGRDFYEGIRAQLVDKDRNPKWQPATLDEVSDAEVDRHFVEPSGGDLVFG